MYAVIETGGKQYRVEVGTELEVELLDAEPGKTVTLDRVLLVADGDDASIGQPLVDGAAVSAEILRRDRGPKLISFKYRPKARTRVKKGHRQELTILRISDITLNGKSAAKSAAKAESDAKTERQRVEEAAAAQAAKDAELAAKLAAPKASTRAPGKKATAKAADTDAKAEEQADTKTAAKADTKTAPKKTTTKAKAADADTAEAAPKKSAPKRATKKDE
jgi:large subunit ribosomal protein L21